MRRIVVVFSLMSCALSAVAATCPGKVAFQETFTKPNPGFATGTTETYKSSVGGGKFTIQLLSGNQAKSELYQADVFDDVNVCLTVRASDADKTEKRNAGILFFAKDYSTYYVFQVDTGGSFGVARYVGGRWINPLPMAPSAALKQGPGVVNSLRVQLRGETATLFINDQQVGQIQGHPVDGGSEVGFYGDSTTATGNTWEYTDFSVMKP